MKPANAAHCHRCAPWLHREADEYPGKVPLDCIVLKEDLARLIYEVERANPPKDVLAPVADAKARKDHVEGLDVLMSALVRETRLPRPVAMAFNDAAHHFGLIRRDGATGWLFEVEEMGYEERRRGRGGRA